MDTHMVTLLAMLVCNVEWVFSDDPVMYSIEEELPVNSYVGNFARDARVAGKVDTTVTSPLSYSLTDPNDRLFLIEESTGVIRTRVKIDRDGLCPGEEECPQSFRIRVSGDQYVQVVSVTVEILDINDNDPYFSQSKVALDISESSRPGALIPLPFPEDIDSPQYGPKRYMILPQTVLFDLQAEDSLDGSVDLQLVLVSELDREQKDFYQIQIVVIDGGEPSKSGTLDVDITVEDYNDNKPEFSNKTYTVSVPENLWPNSTITTVTARDTDILHNGQIRYSLSDRTSRKFGHIFGIDSVSGEIYVKEMLDAEDETEYQLVVAARDNGPRSKVSFASVTIYVQDMNDNSPQMDVFTGHDNGELSEDDPIHTFVAHVTVRDEDSADGGNVTCSINDTMNFVIQETTPFQYSVLSNNMFDREEQDRYYILITCTDHGDPPLHSAFNLMVEVQDINDQYPAFSQAQYTAKIQENNVPEAFVVQVHATDKDLGPNAQVLYSLANEKSGYFRINQETGIIRVTHNLDYEELQFIEFSVVATDMGLPPLSSSATVKVSIEDRNDNPPVFIQANYSFGVYENMAPDSSVGVVSAHDIDSAEYSEIHYKLQSDDQYVLDAFRIDLRSGKLFTRMQLDRESIPVYQLQVMAYNPDYDLTSTATVLIYVADVNDNAPEFDFPNSSNDTVLISNLVPYGHVVTRVRAHDGDISENAQLSFALIQGNEEGAFDMDQRTGALTVTKDLSKSSSALYNLSVEVVDNGETPRTAIRVLHIDVNSSIPYAFGDLNNVGNEDSPNFNAMIVIGVGCASGAIIVALVIAILAIRFQDGRRKRDRRYNCRMEAQKMLYIAPGGFSDGRSTPSDKEVPLEPPVEGIPDVFGLHTKYNITNNDMTHGPLHNGDNNIQMGSGPLGTLSSRTSSFNDSGSTLSKHCGSEHGRNRQPWSRDSTLQKLAPCQASPSQPMTSEQTLPIRGTSLTEPGCNHGYLTHSDSLRSEHKSPPVSHCFPAHAAAVGKHPTLGHILENTQTQPVLWRGGDCDTESACSGDMSNTDSGRGASEEGEGAHGNTLHILHHKHPESRFLDIIDPNNLNRENINKVGCHGNTSSSDDSEQSSFGRQNAAEKASHKAVGLRVLDAPSKSWQTNPSHAPSDLSVTPVTGSSGPHDNTNGTTNSTFTGPQPLPQRHKLSLSGPGTSRPKRPPPPSPPRSPRIDTSWQRGRHLNPRVTPRPAVPHAPWTDLHDDDGGSSTTSGSYVIDIDNHLRDGATEV